MTKIPSLKIKDDWGPWIPTKTHNFVQGEVFALDLYGEGETHGIFRAEVSQKTGSFESLLMKLLEDNGSWVGTHRWNMFEDGKIKLYLPNTQKVSGGQVSSTGSTKDISDWRTWAYAGLREDECICRIPRSQCKYH